MSDIVDVNSEITAISASAVSASAGVPVPQQEPAYGDIPTEPVLQAVDGIRFDFNCGVRVQFPNNEKTYHLTLIDIDTATTLFSADTTPGAMAMSVKKYYVRFRIIIHEKGVEKPIFEYDMDLSGKEVLVQLTCPTIGDAIGWFSYVERFQKKFDCKVICAMMPHIADMFRRQYPEITFIGKNETKNYRPYATYYMGLFFKGDVDWQPIDFRYIGLHRTAGYILGLRTEAELADEPPRFGLSAERRIKEPYVVIAVQSSSQAKYWNNPFGWDRVIDFLKKNGYRVVCIDKERVHGTGVVWNHMPWGVEDDTGDKSLQERIDVIKDADFFIGLSSGLSWVAWGCRVPVVMISGFTHPTNEFFTPYRVINYHTCHSCWNDMRENFDHNDFFWCPRQKGTNRQFECTSLISPEQVIATIRQIPAFQKQAAKKR